jgi:hypothetical protein
MVENTDAALAAWAAAGVGSALMAALGVDALVIFSAVCACFLGAPAAKPTGSVWRVGAVFLCAVVLTCRLADGLALLVIAWSPTMAGKEVKVQAGLAALIGLAIFVVLANLPGIVRGLLARFGVETAR